MQNQLDAKIEEANRVRSRIERNYQETAGNWEDERRRTKKQLEALEEQLSEARDAAYKAQKSNGSCLSRPEDVIPQGRRHPETSLVVREVMVEMRAALAANRPDGRRAQMHAIVNRFVIQKTRPDPG